MLAAGAVLALVIAYWGWRAFGPAAMAPSAQPTALPEAAGKAIIAAAPFGRAPPAPVDAAAAGGATTGSGLQADARLLGVFAARDGTGYALLRFPDRGAVLVASGQDIAPDVKLEAVRPDGIRIRDRGTSRDIPLRSSTPPPAAAPATSPPSTRRTIGSASAAAAAAPAATPTVAAAGASRAGCALPAGFSGPVYRLNAELLTGMAAQPASWGALLAPANGALIVRDATGLATMLGMKTGDRMLQANGIALAAIDDMLSAVVKPLVASQPVRVSGTRDGKPREWLFLNAGACPS